MSRRKEAPRNYPLPFYHMRSMDSHYAMIGMAHVAQGYPLYYDATLSNSEEPDTEFIFVKAALTKREGEDKSPGRPSAPIPRLYVCNGSKVFITILPMKIIKLLLWICIKKT